MSLTKISTLATALMIFSGINYAHPDYSQSPSSIEIQLPLRYIKKLEVNLKNTERTIALNKCEDEGVQDIIELLKKSPYEELWVYLSEKCEWYEIGSEEKYTPDRSETTIDKPYLTSLMKKNKELVVFHFHPLLENMRHGSSGSTTKTKENEEKNNNFRYNLRLAMPSLPDIHLMIDTSWEFDQLNPKGDGELEHKVVTENGISIYGLTNLGKTSYNQQRKYEKNKEEPLYDFPPIIYDMIIKFAFLMSDKSLDSIISKSHNDIQEAAKIIANKLSGSYVKIDFINF